MSEYLQGLNEVIENIQEAVDSIEHGSVRGLADALLFVGTESQQRAPVEYGDLRGSLEIDIDGTVIAKGVNENPTSESGNRIKNPSADFVVVAQTPENGTVGTVSYNEPYAAVQHERVDFKHPLGGEAKYLEKVLNGEQDRILKRIAGGILNDLKG